MSSSSDLSGLPRSDLTDDGGLVLDALLWGTGDVGGAVAEVVSRGYAAMPAGGLTSAIRSFAYRRDEGFAAFRDVVAIRPKGALEAEVVDPATPLPELRSHQVFIDRARGLVAAGAGLTFAQVNDALAKHVDPLARVLVDLTSVGSAFVGGVVATGGMGPMRLPPSATLEAVCVADGGPPRVLTDPVGIASVEGLQGWTGMVSAALFRFFMVPAAEFGLVLPVQGGDVDAMAELLVHLDPWTRIGLPPAGGALAGTRGETLLNGVELVSRDSLAAFIEHAQDPARGKAQSLLQSCEYANADMLACLTGWSEHSIDDVLFGLMDPDTETIGGVMIDFGVGFSSGMEMETFHAIREAAPDLARARARAVPPGRLKPWSVSTDVNMTVPADAAAVADVLAAYADYREAIRSLERDMAAALAVDLSVYGHLSPVGIDLHHRVTLTAPEGGESVLAGARQAVMANRRTLIRDLLHAAERHGGQILGGEKGVPSLLEIAQAAGGVERLSDSLKARLKAARAAVAAAPPAFSFRAPVELRTPTG